MADTDRLLMTLAEQLKTPWLQVSQAAELARQDANDVVALEHLFGTVEVVSQASLQLIDGYLLSAQLEFGQTALELEPVSIASTMYDVAQKLDGYAKAYDCELELEVRGRFGPVMANRRILEVALSNLGYSFIEAAQGQAHAPVKLVLRRNAHGISTGIFSSVEGLSNDLLRRARGLYGFARQPLNTFTANSAAGVFVADTLMSSLQGSLYASRLGELAGLATTFVPSRQLSLI